MCFRINSRVFQCFPIISCVLVSFHLFSGIISTCAPSDVVTSASVFQSVA